MVLCDLRWARRNVITFVWVKSRGGKVKSCSCRAKLQNRRDGKAQRCVNERMTIDEELTMIDLEFSERLLCEGVRIEL